MLTALRNAVGKWLAKLLPAAALFWVDDQFSRFGFKSRTLLFALQHSLEFDPMSGAMDVGIEVLIPVAGKDVNAALLAAASASKFSQNAVVKISFVCPRQTCDELSDQLDSLTRYLNSLKMQPELEVIDENFFLIGFEEVIAKYAGPGRGWIIQQLIKLRFAMAAEHPVLVLDSDTVLTAPRTFLGSEGEQLLAVGTDTHGPYHQHLRGFLNQRRRKFPLSFVTHHQLMKPDNFRRADFSESALRKWCELGISLGGFESFAGSEYQTYGTLCMRYFKDEVVLANWGNRNATLEEFQILNLPLESGLDQLTAHVESDIGSISFHSYLRKS